MWLKLLTALVAVTLATSDLAPRKLYREQDDLQVISRFSDPIDGIDYRLPNNTTPLRYDIFLSTNIHAMNFDFEGQVKIQILARQNTPEITLHARELTITTINLYDGSNTQIQVDVPFRWRADVEFLIITPTSPLLINQIYSVEIFYRGMLRDDDAGFYRSSYINAQGQETWLATTQFESTDARHGFPCYDEPAIRSRYSIEIRHHNSYSAICNMPVASVTPVAGTDFVITKFAEIPSVQSYLIAFTISDFTYAEDLSGHIPQRVFGTPQAIANNEGALAIEVSRKLLEGFENYLGVNYSLPKMDQAAIPDFAAGAMENWGLVTYAEPYLLFPELTGTTRNRENVIATISHEFTHQWFGNLVSPAWWSYLWLNEGFATWLENYVTHIVFPGERWDDTFLIDTVQPVFENDASPTIRPMTYYVENPDRIDRLFDSVAYSKSGSVLRMCHHVLGDATWKKGLNKYLTSRGFDFATSSDLYQSLQAAVDEDFPTNGLSVATIMRSWETQGGFPYITVSRSGNQLTFEQNRFMYATQDSTSLWWVPINYVVGNSPNFDSTKPDLWLQGSRSLTIESASAPKPFAGNDWIVVNSQQSGYYRVNYDSALWELIITQLNTGTGFDRIHLFNRAQLIDDSFHLARAGILDFSTTLNIMKYLRSETDYIPWASTNRANTLLNRWLTGTQAYPQYQAFMSVNVGAIYQRLGVDIIANEPRVDRYARIVAINIACQAGFEPCLMQTTQRLRTMIDSGNALAPDLISSVYCNGMRKADASLFLSMQNKWLGSTSQTERNSIIAALGCTEDTAILNDFLGMVVAPGNTLTANEKSRILSSSINIGENSIRTLIAFAKANAQELYSAGLINTLCNNIGNRITSQALHDEFTVLLNDLRTANHITESVANTYRSNANAILAWQEANLGPILDFFLINQETTPEPTEATTLGASSIVLSAAIVGLSAFVKYVL